MQVSMKITPDLQKLIARLHGDVEGGMSAGMTHVVAALEARAKKEAPVDTSNLVNAITSYITNRGFTGVVKVTDEAMPYGLYVHEGTGIFGPKRRPIVIRPKEKKALYWPGAKHPVKKAEVKGMRPRPFFLKALERTNIQNEFEKGISNYLKRRGW